MKRGKIVWERILTSFGCTTRVSVINVWTQNDPFNDPCDVILTSQMAVSEMVVMRNINIFWSLITPYLGAQAGTGKLVKMHNRSGQIYTISFLIGPLTLFLSIFSFRMLTTFKNVFLRSYPWRERSGLKLISLSTVTKQSWQGMDCLLFIQIYFTTLSCILQMFHLILDQFI